MTETATLTPPMPAGVTPPAGISPDRIVDYDIYNLPDDDLYTSWMGLKESTPHSIVWTPHNGGHWIALEPELVVEVLSNAEKYSSLYVLVPKETAGAAYQFIPLSLDPPVHRPYRKILNDNLYGSAIHPMEAKVRDLTVSLIEGFLDKGSCNFVHDFAEQLPLRVFMQLVDLPVDHLPKLKHLADQFTRPDGSITPQEAADQFFEYIIPIQNERKASDRTDMLANMARGQIDGRPVTEIEAARMAIQVLVGGLDTVVNLMSYAMRLLAQLPEVQARVASEPELNHAVVNECLRRFPIVSSAREIIVDTEVDGAALHKGEMVVAPTELYAMNARMNPDPLKFDLDRRVRNHQVFGSGHHTCPGQFLARMEMKILIEEWFKRIPSFELEPGQTLCDLGGITAGVRPYVLRWPARTN